MVLNTDALLSYGWKPFFIQQCQLDEWDWLVPARVLSVHRDRAQVLSPEGETTLKMGKSDAPLSTWLTVGDWVLAEAKSDCLWLHRVLERSSLLRRQAAGDQTQQQLLAANVDLMLLVMSLNQDFNIHRAQRYQIVAEDAGVEPVVVLTKADLIDDPQPQLHMIEQQLGMSAVAVNGLDWASVQAQLAPWLRSGDTAVLLGSSGVGKSTLTNALLNTEAMFTQDIREDDAKGRHTTTGRYLLQSPSGINLIDTPGMREVQLWVEEGQVASVFDDIEELATACRFRNCQHQPDQPGCAIQAALVAGDLSEDRWQHYQHLLKEEAHHLRQAQGVAAQREHYRSFSKMVKANPSEKLAIRKQHLKEGKKRS